MRWRSSYYLELRGVALVLVDELARVDCHDEGLLAFQRQLSHHARLAGEQGARKERGGGTRHVASSV